MKKFSLLIVFLMVFAAMFPAAAKAGGLDSVLQSAEQEQITGEDANKGETGDKAKDSCIANMMKIEKALTANFANLKMTGRAGTQDGECYLDFVRVNNGDSSSKVKLPELVCDKAGKTFLGGRDEFTYFFHFINAVRGESRQFMFNVRCKIHGDLHAEDLWFDPAKFVQKNPKCLSNMKVISGAVLSYYGKYPFRGRAYTDEGECYLDFASVANRDLKEDIFEQFVCPDHTDRKDCFAYFFYFKKIQKNVIKFNVYCKYHGKFFTEDLPFTVGENGDVTVIMGSDKTADNKAAAEEESASSETGASTTSAADGASTTSAAAVGDENAPSGQAQASNCPSASVTSSCPKASSGSSASVSSSCPNASSGTSKSGGSSVSSVTDKLRRGRITDAPKAANSGAKNVPVQKAQKAQKAQKPAKEDYWSHAVNLTKEGFKKGDFDRVLIGSAQTVAALPGKIIQTNGDLLRSAGKAINNSKWMKEQEAKKQNFIPRAVVTAVGATLQVAGTVQSAVGKVVGTVSTVGGRLIEKIFPWGK